MSTRYNTRRIDADKRPWSLRDIERLLPLLPPGDRLVLVPERALAHEQPTLPLTPEGAPR